MKTSLFHTAFIKLAHAGVIPNDGSGSADGDSMPLVNYVSGYQLRDLGLAFCVGGLFAVLLMIVVPTCFGYSLVSSSHQRIVAAVVASGVNTENLSSADIAARLSYTPEQGRMIVDTFMLGRPNFVEDIATVLNQVPINDRPQFIRDVTRIAATFVSSDYKHQFLNWCLSLDDDTAKRVVSMNHEIASLLQQLTLIPSPDRDKVIAAGFPIRPLDYERADIWRYVNSPDFPATALVKPMAALANSDPRDLAAVYNYITRRQKLPRR